MTVHITILPKLKKKAIAVSDHVIMCFICCHFMQFINGNFCLPKQTFDIFGPHEENSF